MGRPPPVLILTGPPGAGKTTVARLLADSWDRSVHLEADRFFEFIRTGRIDPMQPESQEQNAAVMKIVADAAASYAAAGYFTIVDGIVIPGWFLAPVRDALQAAGHSVAYAILRAPFDECLRRVEARDGIAERDVVEGLCNSFAAVGALERHAVDVGERSPANVAETLGELLRESRLDLAEG